MANKDDVLKAFSELTTEEQQAVREELSQRASESCCSSGEMQKHMGAMMKMMSSSENPMEDCKDMMEMCQKMMTQKTAATGESAAPPA